jgi:hypothetical protein
MFMLLGVAVSLVREVIKLKDGQVITHKYLRQLSVLHAPSTELSPLTTSARALLPLRTVEQFDEFEELISSEAVQKEMVRVI